jgi:hypothetical protein
MIDYFLGFKVLRLKRMVKKESHSFGDDTQTNDFVEKRVND